MRSRSLLPGWWAALPPSAGGAVLAAGILSVGLELTGHGLLSLAALAVSAALWLLLAADFTVRLAGDRGRFRAEADTPAALTAVAATTVLGTRISQLGRQDAAAALLVLAALIWPWLLFAVLRHWRRRMPGVVFLVCVATQGLAVLGAALATVHHLAWLARAALVCFCLGVLLYVPALRRFDLREVRGGAGDHWVAGGALAITALAGA
ncbi:membrane protein, partial [Streptomyces sp. RSD-27]